MTSAAWANPHSLHPWFRMPSLKRKDLSDDEDDVSRALYDQRRSPSPAPSPKRRRCDVLENGMSQLTLDGRPIALPASYALASDVSAPGLNASYMMPTVQFPEAPFMASQTVPSWQDASLTPYIVNVQPNVTTPVVLPTSVEEPISPTTTRRDVEVVDVPMKGPSWYEIEKDRTSTSFTASSATPHPSSSSSSSSATISTHPPGRPPFPRPPRPTVVDVPTDDTGIVITDLEDSDAEDTDTRTASGDADAPSYTISSTLLNHLPKPPLLPRLSPEPNPANALVLYRPLVVPGEAKENEAVRRKRLDEEKDILKVAEESESQPMGEEVPMEDTRPCTPMVIESVDEPVDEPMDIEML